MNNFSLNIVSDNATVRKVNDYEGTYFIMPDRTEYKIVLVNNNATRADAHVWIDNNKVGVWRINGYSQVVIDRPARINRKFTLLREGSYDAKSAGIQSGKPSNGLVRVTFRPELLRRDYDDVLEPNDYYDYNYNRFNQSAFRNNIAPQLRSSNNMEQNLTTRTVQDYATSNLSNSIPRRASTGVTGLGSYSNQSFRIARPIVDFDENRVTTLYARLLVSNNRRYIGLQNAGIYNSNQIPPRIDY